MFVAISGKGGMNMEIRHSVSSAWEFGRSVVEYFVMEKCPEKLKGRIILYRTVFKSVLLVYDAETWSTTKSQERRLEMNETRMQLKVDVWSHEEN